MQDDILIQIGNRIRERRRERNITVQELATQANVSKGLISQIENSRTIPSLIVLIDIIKALDIDLNAFFKDIHHNVQDTEPIIKRKAEYDHFEKEDAEGFHYQRIFTKSIKNSTVDVVILELAPDAHRDLVQTEAWEYKYILTGQVEYIFNNKSYIVNAGDSMLFNGRIPHTPKNNTDKPASMLVVYFFEENAS
jgi:transcriptional regulator with XRE-family HTH domain